MQTYTFGPEIWQKTLKNLENEKCTLQEQKYGKKTNKRGK